MVKNHVRQMTQMITEISIGAGERDYK